MSAVWAWITGGIAHLVAALKGIAASIVGKVLATFGLTMISLEALLPPLKDYILQSAGSLPAEYIEFMGAIGIGKAMSMVLSALSVQLASKVLIVPTPVANALQGIP